MSMMSISGQNAQNNMNISPKSPPFEAYSYVLQHIQTIPSLESFKNYTILQPSELVTISELLYASISKLTDVSEFFVRKTNDVSVSTAVCERLQKMEKLHHELLQLLYTFSNFTQEYSRKQQSLYEITASPSKEEVVGYAYFDLAHRHRIQIAHISEVIRRLNTYALILKDKV